jgi:hypothetical protein
MTNLGNNLEGTGSFATLRRWVRQPASVPHERCELCSAEIRPEHQHLVELAKQKIVCACHPCAILFTSQAAAKYSRVPRRMLRLSSFVLDDQQWDGLLIPINLAFFFRSSTAGKFVAYYPSPAGATESLLDLEYWDAVVEQNPILREMDPAVEALLVNRVGDTPEYYIVPIDQCYRLVGLIRMNWQGLSGGTEVGSVIAQFFSEMRERCAEVQHA